MMKPGSLGTCLLLAMCHSLTAESPVPDDSFFRVETVVGGLTDAMELEVLPNGDLLIAERTGALKRFSGSDGTTRLVKRFDVSVKNGELSRETGLLGIAADPKHAENGWIYAYYSPKSPDEHRLSRFTLGEDGLRDERILLRIPQSRKPGVCHEGGSIEFDSQGRLHLSTGDNTNPFAAKSYPPADERPGHEHENAQRSASNTNDLRGKILRIIPTPDGGYEIPEGNLFPKNETDGKTRPEIYVMGCRNPWRMGFDLHTDILYWADVGPDSRSETPRGPRGFCEVNQTASAGNYGWPYFLADNRAYADYDFETGDLGDQHDATAPENASRLNTGLRSLPPAKVPLWFEPRSSYCAGPVYHHGDHPDSEGKLPPALDSCLITFDWNNGRMQLTKLDDNSRMVWKEDWLVSKRFVHPSDVAIAADGSMYVLEYGSIWYDGTDGCVKKVTFSPEAPESDDPAGPDPRLAGLDPKHPGTALLGGAVCLSCHQTQVNSVGPRYIDVSGRYRENKDAVAILTEKILKGGVGNWGDVPMPPQPQYNEEQVGQMVDAILSLDPGGHKE